MLTLDADGTRLRPAAARGVALGPMSELTIHLDDAESLVAEAARSRALAAGPGDGLSDALSRHLQADVNRGRPAGCDGRAAIRAGAGPHHRRHGVWAGRRHPGRGVCRLRRPRRRERAAVRTRRGAARHRRTSASRSAPSCPAGWCTPSRTNVRKLSLHLHDGPLQTLSGVAMMLDAVAEDLTAVPTSNRRADPRDRPHPPAHGDPHPAGAVLCARAVGAARPGLRDRHGGARRRIPKQPPGRDHTRHRPRPTGSVPTIRCACTRSFVRRSPTPSSTPGRRESRWAWRDPPRPATRCGSPTTARDSPTGPTTGCLTTAWPSMRERASILAGQLLIDSTPGAGTTVTITMPAEASDAA